MINEIDSSITIPKFWETGPSTRKANLNQWPFKMACTYLLEYLVYISLSHDLWGSYPTIWTNISINMQRTPALRYECTPESCTQNRLNKEFVNKLWSPERPVDINQVSKRVSARRRCQNECIYSQIATKELDGKRKCDGGYFSHDSQWHGNFWRILDVVLMRPVSKPPGLQSIEQVR